MIEEYIKEHAVPNVAQVAELTATAEKAVQRVISVLQCAQYSTPV